MRCCLFFISPSVCSPSATCSHCRRPRGHVLLLYCRKASAWRHCDRHVAANTQGAPCGAPVAAVGPSHSFERSQLHLRRGARLPDLLDAAPRVLLLRFPLLVSLYIYADNAHTCGGSNTRPHTTCGVSRRLPTQFCVGAHSNCHTCGTRTPRPNETAPLRERFPAQTPPTLDPL